MKGWNSHPHKFRMGFDCLCSSSKKKKERKKISRGYSSLQVNTVPSRECQEEFHIFIEDICTYDGKKFFPLILFYAAALSTGTALTQALRWVWEAAGYQSWGERPEEGSEN